MRHGRPGAAFPLLGVKVYLHPPTDPDHGSPVNPTQPNPTTRSPMNASRSLKQLALAAALPLSLLAASPATQAAFTGPGTVTLKGGKSTLNFHP